MKIITTTKARENIKSIINLVKYNNESFILRRRNEIEAMIIGFPSQYNPDLNEITNINAYSGSFDFLKNEPDIYSVADVNKLWKKKKAK